MKKALSLILALLCIVSLCIVPTATAAQTTQTPADVSGVKTAVTTEKAVVSWSASSGASGYRFFIWNTTEKKWDIGLKSTRSLKVEIENLTPGTAYIFAVRSYYNTGSKIIWAKSLTKITVVTKPETVSVVKATPGEKSVNLKWTASEGATGYRVYMYVPSTKSWKSIKTTTARSLNVTGLTQGTKYIFAVKPYAKKAGITSWASKYTQVKTATVPASPTFVKAVALNDTQVKLTWTKSTGATGYRVYIWNTRSKSWNVACSVATSNSATITSLTGGKTYIFAVRPFINTGTSIVWGGYTKANVTTPIRPSESASTNVSTVTTTNPVGTAPIATTSPSGTSTVTTTNVPVTQAPTTPEVTTAPEAPSFVIYTSQSTSSVKLKWTASEGATGYRIYIWNTSKKAWDVSRSVVYGTTVTINNLTAGKSYIFAVRPYTNTGTKILWGSYTKVTAKVTTSAVLAYNKQIAAKAVSYMTALKSEKNMTAVNSEYTSAKVVECTGGSTIKDTVNNILSKLMEGSKKTTTYKFTNGKATVAGETVTPKSVIPPAGRAYDLDASGIKACKTEKQGNNTVYTIVLEAELTNDLPTHNMNALGFYDFVTYLSDGITVTESNICYPGSTIVMTVNASGKIVNLKTTMESKLDVSSKVLIMTADMLTDMSHSENWSFTY